MSRQPTRRDSFVERVLDGNARLDQFEDEVRAWQAGTHARPLHEVLGMSANELLIVARTPDALRYLINARRFGGPAPSSVASQQQVRDLAIRLAAEHTDPFEIAAVDGWLATIDTRASSAEREAELPAIPKRGRSHA